MPCVKSMWLNSLSFKVLLAYVVGVALSILLFAAVAFALITSKSDLILTTDVAERTQEIADELEFDAAGIPVGFDAYETHRTWTFESLDHEIGYRVMDTAMNVVLTSTPPSFWSTVVTGHPPTPGKFTFEREGLLMYASTAAAEHNGTTWYVQFAASSRLMSLLHDVFAWPFMAAGIALFSLVLLFVFGVCAYITLGYTLKPLREVSESAAAISPRSLHARLEVRTVPSEVAPLVTSFNRTLERLEDGYRVQQEFLATAAHELKTPLALIRAQIELAEESQGRTALLDDVAHMTRQVQQLLLLAEASEAHNYQVETVDIREVGTQASRYLQRMAEASDVRLVVADDVTGDGLWQADRSALFTLLKNLLENALQHAPRGTQVRLQISADTLTVRDWGPGVAPQELSQIFVRFWRGAHRRDHGAGLGLTICREIAQAHGWTLSAQRAEPGLLFSVSRAQTPHRPKVHRTPSDHP